MSNLETLKLMSDIARCAVTSESFVFSGTELEDRFDKVASSPIEAEPNISLQSKSIDSPPGNFDHVPSDIVKLCSQLSTNLISLQNTYDDDSTVADSSRLLLQLMTAVNQSFNRNSTLPQVAVDVSTPAKRSDKAASLSSLPKSSRPSTERKKASEGGINSDAGELAEEIHCPYPVDLTQLTNDITYCFIELGSHLMSCGIFDLNGRILQPLIVTVPSVSAKSLRRMADEVVQGANRYMADNKFQKFRETGLFIGSDAYDVAFNFPEPGLRASLTLSSVIKTASFEKENELLALIQYCLVQMGIRPFSEEYGGIVYAPERQDPNSMIKPEDVILLLPLKTSFSKTLIKRLIDILFSCFRFRGVDIMWEPCLFSLSCSLDSATVVDIGEFCTTITAVYQFSVVMNDITDENASIAFTTPIGGWHITEYLLGMLGSKNCQSNQGSMLTALPAQRQRELVRNAKEKHCFVAPNFSVATEDFGAFKVKKQKLARDSSGRRVRMDGDDSVEESVGDMGSGNFAPKSMKRTNGATARASEIEAQMSESTVNETFSCTLDIERFHAPEILFQPALYADLGDAIDLVSATMQCWARVASTHISSTEPVLPSVMSNVILAGETSRIPGLKDRFERELYSRMLKDFNNDCARPAVKCCPSSGRLSPLMMAEETRFTYYKLLDSVVTQDAYDTYRADGVLSRCL